MAPRSAPARTLVRSWGVAELVVKGDSLVAFALAGHGFGAAEEPFVKGQLVLGSGRRQSCLQGLAAAEVPMLPKRARRLGDIGIGILQETR